ncbi:MAG: hypothetical protein WC749_02340 [Dehalococcoidia bacterium]
MAKYFFHNRHDRESWQILYTLDASVQVFDVYGGDKLPDNVHLTQLPFLTDEIPTAKKPLSAEQEIIQLKSKLLSLTEEVTAMKGVKP